MPVSTCPPPKPAIVRFVSSDDRLVRPWHSNAQGRLSQITGPSEFDQYSTKMGGLLRQLDDLRGLAPNWNSYGSPVPNSLAFQNLQYVLSAVSRSDLEVSKIVPSADGGIGVCFVKGGAYAHIEASNEGELVLVMYSQESETYVEDLPPTDTRIANALKQIGMLLGL